MCCKSVCVQAFARHTHRSETPTNSSYFYTYISVEIATAQLLVPLTALFCQVTSNLHVKYPSAQSTLALTLALKLLALTSKTSGLGLDNAVLEHIPDYIQLTLHQCIPFMYHTVTKRIFSNMQSNTSFCYL